MTVKDFLLLTASHYTWVTIYKLKLKQEGILKVKCAPPLSSVTEQLQEQRADS